MKNEMIYENVDIIEYYTNYQKEQTINRWLSRFDENLDKINCRTFLLFAGTTADDVDDKTINELEQLVYEALLSLNYRILFEKLNNTSLLCATKNIVDYAIKRNQNEIRWLAENLIRNL